MSNQVYQLSDRYQADTGQVLLTGVQALARIPLEQLRRDRVAGRNTAALLSGYPGSPLGGFDLEAARAIRLAPELPIVHQPAVNEELGATSVMGSQLAAARPDATYDGVVGFWYGKAPGLDRACDALRHAVFAGTSEMGGAVALVGDDPACKSSTMPSSSDATLVDLHMPILYPGTAAECLELGLHAVALSRTTGLWAGMKIVASVADGSGTVALPVLAEEPIISTVEVDGKPWTRTPSAQFIGAARMLETEREFREIRLPLATQYGIDNKINRITVNPSDAWIGLVASGFTYHEMIEALRRLGFSSERDLEAAGIRILQLRMPVPFDTDLVRSFAKGLDEIVVIEEKNPTLEWLIKDALYGSANQPIVSGKKDPTGELLMRSWGQLDADAIVSGLRSRLDQRLAERLRPEAPTRRTRELIPLAVDRTPFFCSGCPHNWGTKAPEGALIGAGTGCHGMTLLMDEERVGETTGITAMGNEGAQWIGMQPFVKTEHIFQNYGDGTFMHSGQLALQYCVGADVDMTFKILYNGTVAMTGGQDSPAPLDVPTLAEVCLAHGVKKVAITAEDPGRYKGVDLPSGVRVHDRDDIVDVQEQLAAISGVTVLIHDQYCAAELRRDRKRGNVETPTKRIVINHRICEGCGDCGDVSNCLSVQPIDTPLGRKTTIDQASCNFDYSCAKGDCPAFMVVEADPDAPAAASSASREAAPHIELAKPNDRFAENDLVRIRTAGIGGTGVVTVSQIMATAAMFSGWEVRGLDQTGLSQKAGPVISDIVLAKPGSKGSNIIGAGQADVLIGFDALVAASDNAISATDKERTAAVMSTTTTPTGFMISHPETAHPTESVDQRLGAATSSVVEADASSLAERLTGGGAQGNVFLLGVAFQLGHIPVSAEAMSQAIELNGVAVEANQAAFDWGRRWVVDSETVESFARSSTHVIDATDIVTVPDLPKRLSARVDAITTSTSDAFTDTVSMLTADLVGYQDERYARTFLDDVEEALRAERSVRPDSTELTEVYARHLHKLMAYKDEYEVARLLLMPEARGAAEAVAGEGATVAYKLHPPMLKALGLDKKLTFSERTEPLFAKLSTGKKLRGTRLDPFGRSEMRRMEQSLPGEFRAAMTTVFARLSEDTFDAALDVAGLPDMVRGYEELKTRRAAEFRQRLAEAVKRVEIGM